jgi:hypothetical protein
MLFTQTNPPEHNTTNPVADSFDKKWGVRFYLLSFVKRLEARSSVTQKIVFRKP